MEGKLSSCASLEMLKGCRHPSAERWDQVVDLGPSRGGKQQDSSLSTARRVQRNWGAEGQLGGVTVSPSSR